MLSVIGLIFVVVVGCWLASVLLGLMAFAVTNPAKLPRDPRHPHHQRKMGVNDLYRAFLKERGLEVDDLFGHYQYRRKAR